jgi:hypothetical protein
LGLAEVLPAVGATAAVAPTDPTIARDKAMAVVASSAQARRLNQNQFMMMVYLMRCR